jgi:hypothetical protein
MLEVMWGEQIGCRWIRIGRVETLGNTVLKLKIS